MNKPEILAALEPVVEAFEGLGVPYYLVGSIASSAYGMGRATMDVDLVCDLGADAVPMFVDRLKPAYYVDGDMILDAIARRSSFNVIHLESMIKIDGFVPGYTEYERQAFERRRRSPLEQTPEAMVFYIASPEDVVLQKIAWYRHGGRTSDRQWNDILGVIRVQGDALDKGYLARWAGEMGNTDLLTKAWEEAGEKGWALPQEA